MVSPEILLLLHLDGVEVMSVQCDCSKLNSNFFNYLFIIIYIEISSSPLYPHFKWGISGELWPKIAWNQLGTLPQANCLVQGVTVTLMKSRIHGPKPVGSENLAKVDRPLSSYETYTFILCTVTIQSIETVHFHIFWTGHFESFWNFQFNSQVSIWFCRNNDL